MKNLKVIKLKNKIWSSWERDQLQLEANTFDFEANVTMVKRRSFLICRSFNSGKVLGSAKDEQLSIH